MSEIDLKKLLSDQSIRRLMKINNGIAIRDLSVRVLVELFLISVVYYFFKLECLVPCAIAYYLLAVWHSFWGYAGIGHELMHGRVFSNKSANKILYYIASFLVWSNPAYFKTSHAYHHSHTYEPMDSESNNIQNWTWIYVISYLLIDIPFMFRKVTYLLLNSLGLKFQGNKFLKIDGNHRQSAIYLLFFQFLINVGIFLLTHNLLLNLMWVTLPFTAQFVNRVLAQSQHIGLKMFSNDGPLRHSRSIKLPSILTFLYAGMNYHAEHHLLPSIPYYNLPIFSSFISHQTDFKLVNWVQFFTDDFWLLVHTKKYD